MDNKEQILRQVTCHGCGNSALFYPDGSLSEHFPPPKGGMILELCPLSGPSVKTYSSKCAGAAASPDQAAAPASVTISRTPYPCHWCGTSVTKGGDGYVVPHMTPGGVPCLVTQECGTVTRSYVCRCGTFTRYESDGSVRPHETPEGFRCGRFAGAPASVINHSYACPCGTFTSYEEDGTVRSHATPRGVHCRIHDGEEADSKIGVTDFVEDKQLSYNLGTAVYFISLSRNKGPAQAAEDLQEAAHHVRREITRLGVYSQAGQAASPVKTSDPVNHPSHYTDGKIEVISFIDDKKLSFCLGNAVKYISRAGKKDAAKTAEDLEKSIWYIKHEIERLKGQDPLR